MGKNDFVRFNNKADRSFFIEVSKKTQEYLKTTNQSPFANRKWWFKVATVFLIMVGSYALMITQVVETGWFFILTMTILSFSGVMLGFNVAHDASHNALFRNKKYNYILLRAFDLVGISGYFWVLKHVRSHHKFTNIAGLDADIANQKLLRFSPLTPILPHHRFQVYFAPLVYAQFSIFLIYVKDFMMLFSSEIGDQKDLKHPAKEVVLMIVSKLFYTTYGLVIPLMVLDLPVGTILLGFWISHMVASLFAVMILAPVHMVDETVFPEPENKSLSTNWSVHQLDCTSDFALNSPIVAWMCGGLNQHLAHHLCPTICHIHYGPLTKIVQEAARNNGLNYKSNSWWEAIQSHWRFLSRMSKEINPYKERIQDSKKAA